MGVQVDRKVIITLPNKQVVTVPGDSTMATDTNVILTCSGPRCAARNGLSQPKVVRFNEEKVKTDVNALPDDYARVIRTEIHPFNPEVHVFCSKQCNKDFLDYVYVEDQSPREKAQRQTTNQIVDQKNYDETISNIISFPPPVADPIDPISPIREGANPRMPTHF